METNNSGQSSDSSCKNQRSITEYLSSATQSNELTMDNIKQLIEKNTDRLITEIQLLRSEVTHLKTKNNELNENQLVMKQEIETLKKEKEELKNNLNDLEQWSRHSSIRLFNVDDTESTETHIQSEKKVNNILIKMGLSHLENKIDIAHRVGPYNPTRNRPIIVKFFGRKEKIEVMKKRKLLKGTKIGLAEDLTARNAQLYSRCRHDPNIDNVWTREGNIFAKTRDGKILKVGHDYYQDSSIRHKNPTGRNMNIPETQPNSPAFFSTPRPYQSNVHTNMYDVLPLQDLDITVSQNQ